jgi:phage repressor protein C with HTH and peptisase S24 domain
MTGLGGRIRQAAWLYPGKQKALAKAIDVRPNTISRWVNGKLGNAEEYLEKIAEAANVDLDWLRTGEGQPRLLTPYLDALGALERPDEAENAEFQRGLSRGLRLIAAAPPPLSDLIPVLGVAEGSLGGSFAFTGQALAFVRRLPSLAHLPDVYAMKVAGLSMAPRYQPGDVVVVDPRRAFKAGDIIVIHTQNHSADRTVVWLKQLVEDTGDRLIVRQLSDGAKNDWSKSIVKSVHRVLTGNELLGL